MSKYTDAQAKRKAQMVVSQLGSKIKAACLGTGIGPAFLAGKIGVEAGVRGGKIVESATRFEAHVFRHLRNIIDHGFTTIKGRKRKSYNGIFQKDIKDATDAALKNLATSYGVSQIMGWHMIHNLAGTIADLRHPDKHLAYTVQLMILMAGSYLKAKNYDAALRIWNTGSAKGETHDPDYVHNALLVMSYAKPLLKEVTAIAAPPEPSGTMNVPEVIAQAETVEIDPDDDLTDWANVDDNGDDDIDDALDGFVEQPKANPAPAPIEQKADTIINNNPDSGGNNAPPPAENQPPAQDPTEKTMEAPPPQDLKSKIRNFLVALGVPVTGAGITAAISSAWQDGTVNFREAFTIFIEVFRFVLPYATYALIAYVVYKTIQMIFIQISFIKRMEINGDTTKNDIKVVPAQPDERPLKSRFLKIF